MAATLLLAVAGVFMVGQQERLEAAFVAQLAIDHQKCFTEFGPGHTPLDPVRAEARLATLGFDVSVPTGDNERIALVDVRVCDYDEGHMAHLLYEVDGQPFSLFFVPEARHGEGTFEVLDQQERLWSAAGEACVLIGPKDSVAMDQVTAYVRGSE